MENLKNDAYYVKKIKSYVDFAKKALSNKTMEEFENNTILINSIMFSFIQISENSSKLSENFKINKSFVPWDKVRSIRNIIVHDYDIVDYSIIYDTVKYDFDIFDKI